MKSLDDYLKNPDAEPRELTPEESRELRSRMRAFYWGEQYRHAHTYDACRAIYERDRGRR